LAAFSGVGDGAAADGCAADRGYGDHVSGGIGLARVLVAGSGRLCQGDKMSSSRRPSPALVISLLALFVSLGGVGYAATKITGKAIKDGTVTGKDVKNSSLSGVDVKDRSLAAKDFKAGSLPAGPRGPQGLTGPPGPTGSPGAPGKDASLASLEEVHAVGPAPSQPQACPPASFCTGFDDAHWDNFGNGYQAAGFYKDQSGLVHLQGSVKAVIGPVARSLNGSSSHHIFYLPADYRPSGIRAFRVYLEKADTTTDLVQINVDGSVDIHWPSNELGDVTYASLDGITFRP
jgi:hypothetical protein